MEAACELIFASISFLSFSFYLWCHLQPISCWTYSIPNLHLLPRHMTCRKPGGCGHEFCWICDESQVASVFATGRFSGVRRGEDQVAPGVQLTGLPL